MAINAQQIKRFRGLCARLNTLINEIRDTTCPTAEIYAQVDTLVLMKGPHHAGLDAEPQRQNAVTAVIMSRFDGGAW